MTTPRQGRIDREMRRELNGLRRDVAAWPPAFRHCARLGWIVLAAELSCAAVAQEIVGERADAEAGRLVFNNACRTCHTTREGENRLGPHLNKIIGRNAGSVPNYAYSSGMKGADFTWDEKKLERFIANPDETVPGNTMKPYGGLASADSRANVIAFLQSLMTDQ
jgi:cytochrome c